MMASELNTEYEIVSKRVSLKKIEYNKNNPLALSYGHGNGFRSGVSRSNTSDKQPVEILFVQGGSENIDLSKYGSSELPNEDGTEWREATAEEVAAHDAQVAADEERARILAGGGAQ